MPLFFLSCAANKVQYELHKNEIVFTDTIVISELHIHNPEENKCVYIQKMIHPITDTVRLEYYIPKK